MYVHIEYHSYVETADNCITECIELDIGNYYLITKLDNIYLHHFVFDFVNENMFSEFLNEFEIKMLYLPRFLLDHPSIFVILSGLNLC